MAPSPALTTGFIDYRGKLIAEGTCFYADAWGYRRPVGVNSHFLWHVERNRAGVLVLVADGAKKRILLTRELVSYLVVYDPAPGPGLPEYPEPWGWWRALGWGVVLRQVYPMAPGEERGVELQAYKDGRARAMHFEADSWALLQKNPHALERLIGEALFYVVHSRKGPQLGVLGQDRLPDEVYLPFVEKMRRKVKRLGIS
ncbi:MAG: hypothetical protein ACRYFV_13735 [Janthinobacterium lividum]